MYERFLMPLIFAIEEGKSFGEVALMSEDSVRNATVIADEETDLLVISRELFNRSMKVQASVPFEKNGVPVRVMRCHSNNALFSLKVAQFRYKRKEQDPPV